MTLADQGFLELGSMRLEYRMIGPRPDAAPTIVMLHEGLGCVGLWGDFPDRVAAATGAGVFVYSRAGYGHSSPVALPRPLTFMHEEACLVLPRLLDAIGFCRGILAGHSDGASIAAIHAGSVEDHRVRGLALVAPHFFTEDCGIAEIARVKDAYATTDLREKLARWHADVDNAVRGWSDAWLDPDFRRWDITDVLAYIRVPVLIVQGEDDQYGSIRQIEVAREECYCPVDVALMPGVRHAPHREAPDALLRVVADFANHLFRDHREGEIVPAQPSDLEQSGERAPSPLPASGERSDRASDPGEGLLSASRAFGRSPSPARAKARTTSPLRGEVELAARESSHSLGFQADWKKL
jgi:pimeloyl-ACP methyl ester carboxylesterase